MTGRKLFCAAAVLGCLAPALGHSEPPAVSAPAFVVGDEWVFDRTQERGISRIARSRVALRVDRLDPDAMLVGTKPDRAPSRYVDHRIALDWTQSRVIGGKLTVTGRPFKFPMAPGDSWNVKFREAELHDGQINTDWDVTYTVVGWTEVTTPAATFHALEIKETGSAQGEKTIPRTAKPAKGDHTRSSARRVSRNTVYGEFYYVPSIKYYVKYVQEEYDADNIRTGRDEDVLASFKPGASPTATPANRP